MKVEAETIEIKSYSWGLFYLIVMSAECLVTKKIVSSIKLQPWGLVLYNNVVCSPVVASAAIERAMCAALNGMYSFYIPQGATQS